MTMMCLGSFVVDLSAALVVEFPSSYPDVPPMLEVESEKGLSATQVDDLQSLSDRIAIENIGSPSIFIIAEAIKEWLQDNNVAGQDGSMYADMMRRMQQKDVEQKKRSEKAAVVAMAEAEKHMTTDKLAIDKEEEERIRMRQEGTAVTIETFMAWKAAFDEEQRLLQLQSGKEAVKDERPTGKQLFVSNKARIDDGESPLDFGDLGDYEGLIQDGEEDADDEDYNPDEYGDDDESDDDEDYSDEDDVGEG